MSAFYLDCTDIGMLSYISVQAYEQSHRMLLRAVFNDTAVRIRAWTFVHVPAYCFLCLLPVSRSLSHDKQTITISSEGLQMYDALRSLEDSLLLAIEDLRRQRHKGDPDEGGDRNLI